MAGGLPRCGVDGREQVLGLGVPGPAQVACQLAERVQRLGQDGTDGESTDGSHRSTVMQIDLNDPIFASPPATRRVSAASPARYVRAHGRTNPRHGRVTRRRRRPLRRRRRRSASPSRSAPLVFREGHDALNADVVAHRPGRHPPAPVRMHQGRGTSPTSGTRDVHPRRGRRLDVRDRVLERPGRHLAAQRRDQDPGRASTSS